MSLMNIIFRFKPFYVLPVLPSSWQTNVEWFMWADAFSLNMLFLRKIHIPLLPVRSGQNFKISCVKFQPWLQGTVHLHRRGCYTGIYIRKSEVKEGGLWPKLVSFTKKIEKLWIFPGFYKPTRLTSYLDLRDFFSSDIQFYFLYVCSYEKNLNWWKRKIKLSFDKWKAPDPVPGSLSFAFVEQ